VPKASLVSVVIPCFNRPERVAHAVRSVVEQTYSNLELLLVDDGSTVDLSEARALLAVASGKYFRLERSGVACARNFGANQARGDWLAFLDSDDEWLPEKLELQVKAHEKNGWLVSQTEEVWFRQGKRVNPRIVHAQPDGDAFELSVPRCVVSASSVLLPRDLFWSVGGFDERLALCEDYDFWLRLALITPIHLVREFLVDKYGGHEDQLSHSEPALDRYRVFALLKLLLDGELSEAQETLVVRETVRKLKVLANGARKRDLTSLEVYEDISQYLRLDERSLDQGRQLLLQLERELTTPSRVLNEVYPARAV